MRSRFFLRQHSPRWLPFALYLVTVLTGLAVTSGDYLNKTLENDPWIGPVIIGAGVVAMVATLFYKRRTVRLMAALFPLLMVVILVFNQTEDKVGWSLRRQPSNSLLDLSGGLKNYGAYLYLADHFESATVITAPDLLPSTTLTEWALQDWGRVRAVKTEMYDATLTQAEGRRLMLFDPVVVDTQYGTFIFVTSPDSPEAVLYLARYNEVTYMVSSDIFTSLREES